MARAITYKRAGVDIALKQSLIPLFGAIAKSTSGADVLAGVGGFGALVGLNGALKMRSPVLVAGTDGVGTKLLIAFKTGRHDTVGIDCVAMCVNDIICHAARPLFFLDYIGSGKLRKKIALEIVAGVARGCVDAGMSLVGGETAQLSGLYKPGEYDLAGFAVGIVERENIPDRSKVRAGDVLVGIASSGLHSNGFSLVRKVLLERAKLKLEAKIPALEWTLGEELLRPTTIYARAVVEMFDKFKVSGLANITGGGLIENVPRAMPRNTRAVFERGSWPTPPIFDLIQRAGKISRLEMDRTFNNGLGMVAIVPPREADRVIDHLRRRNHAAYVVGEVRRGKSGVSFA
jgi:phosphoribosylformylglycinamidine cyclo-ligase